MSSLKLFITADSHYGLKSAGFDRTEEIHHVVSSIANQAIEEEADFFIHLGDLGHTANPSAEVHKLWIELFEKFNKSERTCAKFLLGNHDVSSRLETFSGSLSPLEQLAYGPDIAEPITGIKLEDINDDWAFLYLPYMSKRLVLRKIQQLGQSGQSFDDYYRSRVKSILKMTSKRIIVFTHLNLHGAKVDDDILLRPVSATMPRSLYNDSKVKLILSGHIHKPQMISKKQPAHIVVGSPIQTDFGDTDDKRFAVVTLDGKKASVKFRSTDCVKLVELKFDFVGDGSPRLYIPQEVVNNGSRVGLKVSIRMTEAQRELIDVEGFYTVACETVAFVRPIIPVILREGAAKPVKIKGLQDDQMIMNWLRAKKPPKAKEIALCAKEVLENV